MGYSLFSCHEFVLGLGTALAHARLHPIDCCNAASHISIHCTCARNYGNCRPDLRQDSCHTCKETSQPARNFSAVLLILTILRSQP